MRKVKKDDKEEEKEIKGKQRICTWDVYVFAVVIMKNTL
jgi:hypothetical protein